MVEQWTTARQPGSSPRGLQYCPGAGHVHLPELLLVVARLVGRVQRHGVDDGRAAGQRAAHRLLVRHVRCNILGGPGEQVQAEGAQGQDLMT